MANKTPVILIFDIGKTNKKYFLFDECLNALESAGIQFEEKKDDDGFACDDLEAITNWVFKKYHEIKNNTNYNLKYINFSTYGATLVHLDKNGKPCTPLYNYLKPFSDDVKQRFIQLYGDINKWSIQTASPYLGMLNAGLQLFWLKHAKPHLFNKIHTTLFLPQYFCYLFTGNLITEFTGLGCHTGMWNFAEKNYHQWMFDEDFVSLLPSINHSNFTSAITNTDIHAGGGIHDSSAALIPYMQSDNKPFMLLSTGTWSICLNPFNNEPLTLNELQQDCLCYMQPNGTQVKASRFFLGGFYAQCVQQLNKWFDKDEKYHEHILFNEAMHQLTQQKKSFVFFEENNDDKNYITKNSFAKKADLNDYETAYHQLMFELTAIQIRKIYLLKSMCETQKIYVDGGFTRNKIFISYLKHTLPEFELIPSENAIGSALGAAMQLKQ